MKVNVYYQNLQDGQEKGRIVVASFWAWNRKSAIKRFKKMFLTEGRCFVDVLEDEGYAFVCIEGEEVEIFWAIYF